jgi:hypothetical protein
VDRIKIVSERLNHSSTHVDNDAVGLVTLVGMITIAMSTYMNK